MLQVEARGIVRRDARRENKGLLFGQENLRSYGAKTAYRVILRALSPTITLVSLESALLSLANLGGGDWMSMAVGPWDGGGLCMSCESPVIMIDIFLRFTLGPVLSE